MLKKLLLSAFLASALVAQLPAHAQPTRAPSQCPPVIDGGLVTFTFECLNDLTILVTSTQSLGWHYTLDSAFDGLNTGEVGTLYEIYGMAMREFPEEIWVVLNSNVPLAGHPLPTAQNGTIAHGDLFFDLSGLDFATASSLARLYGIRYSIANDSNAPQLGVYKNVRAVSVTSVNSGVTSLADYMQRVLNAGGVLGFGDLPPNQTYYAAPLSLNVIGQGDYLGPITFLTPDELTLAGFNAPQFLGTTTIAFKFAKNLVVDTCGVIGGNGTTCLDCQGVPCGGAQYDLCQVCGGNNSTCKDCQGIPNGSAVFDECNICGGDSSTCKDCKGEINGDAVYDICGVCGGNGTTCLGCDGVAKSGKVFDACGICGGDSSTCKDCLGVPNGGAKADACGVCNGASNTCLDCAGTPNGTAKVDACGICNGTVTDPTLCGKIEQCPSKKLDLCGVCDGTNACLDCAGVPNGGALVDCCGVCKGDGTSCLDKCKFYDLKSIKKKARRFMNVLHQSVRTYSTQELRCSKGKSARARVRLALARKIVERNTSTINTTITDTIKVCDTVFCTKQSLTSIRKSLRVNIKTLYNLSREAQYAAGKSCKAPRRTGKRVSRAEQSFHSANNTIDEVPSVACTN